MTDADQKRDHVAASGAMESPESRAASIRWAAYALLITLAAGNVTGRILSVTNANIEVVEKIRIHQAIDRQRDRLEASGLKGDVLQEKLARYERTVRGQLKLRRPFLSANDRSRWCTIRALVDDGTYAIDHIISDPQEYPRWGTIDMVKHDRSGGPHLYSSKPTLLPTLLAGEYWLLQTCTGWTLSQQPFEVVRTMLICTNVTSLVLMFVLLACLVEKYGKSDWGRMLVMATATLGTFLTTFAVTLNNHLIAAACVTVALFAAAGIFYGGRRAWWWFALAGFFAALAAAIELPVVILLVFLGLALLWKVPRPTLAFGLPAVVLVVVAAAGTNYLAHRTVLPPYAYRTTGENWQTGNWYSYSFGVGNVSKESYWKTGATNLQARSVIDRGEPSTARYAFHCLIGHHGIFSLTPIWVLSVAGVLAMVTSRSAPSLRAAGWLIGFVSVLCFLLYLFQPPEMRNYGGMTAGPRWFFWLIPLWLFAMVPAADWTAGNRKRQILATVLLAIGALSASYPTWNPWTHPWLARLLDHLGWVQI